MARKGYHGITVPEKTIQRLIKAANQERRTVPKQIQHMLDTLYPEEKNPT